MKKITLRKCVGCKEMIEATQLIRIACDSSANFAIDINEGKKKSAGRGAYLCKSEKCLVNAQKSKGLERSFKRAVPQEVYEQLNTVLAGLSPT